MYLKLLALLLLLTAAAAWQVARTPQLPEPPPAVPGGLAPFEGRATLDHQGQSAVSLPGDELVPVTR